MAEKGTKKFVSEACSKTFEVFHNGFGTKDEEWKSYMIAKSREKKSRDLK